MRREVGQIIDIWDREKNSVLNDVNKNVTFGETIRIRLNIQAPLHVIARDVFNRLRLFVLTRTWKTS